MLRWKGYRLFFWSGAREEPPHVPAKKGAGEAKVWLDPPALATAVDFSDHRINELLRQVRDERAPFLSAWHDLFRP